MNDHQPTNHHFATVVPWAFDEYILVNGYQCVYSHDKEHGLLVHLPGCREATLQELRDEGRTIVMPETPRSKRTMVA